VKKPKLKSLDDMVERIRLELPTLLPVKDDKVGDAYLDKQTPPYRVGISTKGG